VLPEDLSGTIRRATEDEGLISGLAMDNTPANFAEA